jgi:hypothetical protein
MKALRCVQGGIMRRFHTLILAVPVLFVVMAASPASAQGGPGFGLEFGITRTTLHAESLSDFIGSRTGFMGGIWFGGNRHGVVGLMGEITYVVKGAKDESSGQDLKLHYLEIPVLLRVNIGQHSTNGVIVYPLFGPVVDIQLKGTLDGLDVTNQFQGYDVGLIGGIGLEAARLGVEVRGNWGLKGLLKEAVGFGGLTDSKNFGVQALAKLRIR